MLNRICKRVLLGVFSLAITVIVTSCSKVKDTIAIVAVKDSAGNPVYHARVILHANPLNSPLYSYNPDNYPDRSLDVLVKLNLDTTFSGLGQNSDIFEADWTDYNGRAEFTLPLPMILNVSVLKIDGNDEYLGAGKINIEKEKTNTQEIKLLNY
ncbi:hypothetical protein OAK24_00855 [Flavobacteriales bacterium]|nr:hypothetical protein [Flavobacteriales bacterium]